MSEPAPVPSAHDSAAHHERPPTVEPAAAQRSEPSVQFVQVETRRDPADDSGKTE
jgi:hypothetical protein